MMIHQLKNTFVPFCVAVFGLFFLVHYVTKHQKELFFFLESCDPGFSCAEMYFEGGRALLNDNGFLKFLKEDVFIPPPKNPVVEGFDIYEPVWRKLVDWYKIQEGLKDAFKDQPPGVFVEIGAVDGNFMSQTIYLEKNLSWTGLLIEPDPRSFKILKEAGRNAWLSPICVYAESISSRKYWLRTLEEGLPHHFTQLLMARSKLNIEILEGDEERGTVIHTPCAPVSLMIKALDMKTVDLLTISTGGEEDKERIEEAIYSKSIDVKTLLIHYPPSILFTKPYPNVKGYILDVQRSQMLVKFYVKMSHCSLLTTDDCIKTHYFDSVRACFTFYCFDYLTVRTFNPFLVYEKKTITERNK